MAHGYPVYQNWAQKPRNHDRIQRDSATNHMTETARGWVTIDMHYYRYCMRESRSSTDTLAKALELSATA